MEQAKRKPFLQKYGMLLILLSGLVAYVAIAGSTNSCSACAAVVDMVTGGK